MNAAAPVATGTSPNSNPRPYILAGLAIVSVMFGGLGAWVALAPLDGAVIAPAVVTVETNRKTVQHLEGGIVAEIFVRDGDYVEGGAMLIRLDSTRAKASLAVIDGELDVLRARQARLIAERDGAAVVRFPDELVGRLSEPNVSEIITVEKAQFEARQIATKGEIDILTQRIGQFEEEIGGLDSQRRSKVRQLELIKDELSGLRDLYEKGYVSRTRILALERGGEQLKGERGKHISDIARAENGVGESRLRIIQVKRDFREQVVEELRDVQARIFELTERRVAAFDESTRLDVRSPQAGTVVDMDVHTIGGVIGPGEPILDVVPEDDELVVEARVQPQDIDKVTLGLSAVVRLSAFDLRSTPELNGTVIAASADRLVDMVTSEPYYLVRVHIPESELAKLDTLELVAGMPAEVFINTGERTALSYLLKPFSDSLARAFKD